jgi:hypothetical protein
MGRGESRTSSDLDPGPLAPLPRLLVGAPATEGADHGSQSLLRESQHIF